MMAFKMMAAGALSLLSTFAAIAAEEKEEEAPAWSANVTLTSDYRFRGQSQTDRDAAVQGGIDYTHPSGFFAGLWASSIDFNDAQKSPAEVDFTGGYSFSFADETAVTGTLAYYWYPDSSPAHYDYFEVLGNVTHDFGDFSLTGDATWSPDYSGRTGSEVGLSASVQVPLTFAGLDWLSASAQFGHQWIEDNAVYGTPDWYFYDFGATVTWEIFALDLRYTGTDTSHADCFGGTELCEGGVVLSLTATLPGA
jgi:uncharacterized protein (TIGR02001 family)